jgi:hypothetical protein
MRAVILMVIPTVTLREEQMETRKATRRDMKEATLREEQRDTRKGGRTERRR